MRGSTLVEGEKKNERYFYIFLEIGCQLEGECELVPVFM